MKKLNWKSILKKAFSPRDADAKAQEKAAAYFLGGILAILFLPLIILQFVLEMAKMGGVFALMGLGLVAHEKFGIKNKVALNIIMGVSVVVSFIALMALRGFLGRLYRGL